MADRILFCPVCLCATSPGQTPAGECVMVCRNEHCQKTVAAAVAADALLTGPQVFELRKRHAQLFAVSPPIDPLPSDWQPWPGGPEDQGGDDEDGESLFPASYLARMFWRDRSIFLTELATLTPSQLARQAAAHVRYLSLHSPAVITPEHQLRVWRRMLDAAPHPPNRQPPLLALVA